MELTSYWILGGSMNRFVGHMRFCLFYALLSIQLFLIRNDTFRCNIFIAHETTKQTFVKVQCSPKYLQYLMGKFFHTNRFSNTRVWLNFYFRYLVYVKINYKSIYEKSHILLNWCCICSRKPFDFKSSTHEYF